MATYSELKQQLASLVEQVDAARQAEFEAVVADIRAKVVEYGITERDIFGGRRGSAAKAVRQVVAVKYRDPKSGATWSGRGRAPAWIKDVKNRDKFLVSD